MEEAGQHFDWLGQKNPALKDLPLLAVPVKDDPFLFKLVSDPRLLDLVEIFLGPNIALFGLNYVLKPPRVGQEALWHQDGFNWPLEPFEAITAWVALDPSTAETGCLQVIPGSHRLELRPLLPRTDIPNLFGWEIDPGLVEEEKAVKLELHPGDVSFHHPHLIHDSKPNRSPFRRLGLSIRYIPASTRIITSGTWPNALLLRGKASPGINQYHNPPG